jgi:hypothetical protein
VFSGRDGSETVVAGRRDEKPPWWQTIGKNLRKEREDVKDLSSINLKNVLESTVEAESARKRNSPAMGAAFSFPVKCSVADLIATG